MVFLQMALCRSLIGMLHSNRHFICSPGKAERLQNGEKIAKMWFAVFHKNLDCSV